MSDQRSTWISKAHYISDFLPCWYIIEHVVTPKSLLDIDRPYCCKKTDNKDGIVAQKLMMDLDLNTFRAVSSFISSNRKRGVKMRAEEIERLCTFYELLKINLLSKIVRE